MAVSWWEELREAMNQHWVAAEEDFDLRNDSRNIDSVKVSAHAHANGGTF
jgi:hypothetical protein